MTCALLERTPLGARGAGRSPRALLTAAFLSGLCLLTAACGGGSQTSSASPEAGRAPTTPAQTTSEPATPGSGVAIALVSPNPPEAGDNAFEVTVTQADGSPLTDAAVAAVFSMPAMPSMNMPPMRTDVALTHAGGGTYRGTGNLEMGGTWNVAITVTKDGAPVGTKRLSVVVK